MSLLENEAIHFNDLVPPTNDSDAEPSTLEASASSDEESSGNETGGFSIFGYSRVHNYCALGPPTYAIMYWACLTVTHFYHLISVSYKYFYYHGFTTDRGDPNDPKVRLKRDCVGIMAAFRAPHAMDKIFLLANTHIYW